jgi:hypothetical protein
MANKGNVAKMISNEANCSFSLTKKMKHDKKKLIILSIDDVIMKMQGACFEGKIMKYYGSYDIGKFSYKCFHLDLVDYDDFQFITLVILKYFCTTSFQQNL